MKIMPIGVNVLKIDTIGNNNMTDTKTEIMCGNMPSKIRCYVIYFCRT